jgi:selenocysteine lyase/cysteine desulfurase
LPVEAAGQRGFATKSRPWERDKGKVHEQVEDARTLAGRLVGAPADQMAVTSAVSYGIATAALNVPCRSGEAVLLLEGEHASQRLAWERFAVDHGAQVEVVQRPQDGDWTTAILDHMARAHGRGLRFAVAALSPVTWNDGRLVDLPTICRVLRARETAIVIDATQGVGVLELDAQALDADFVAFPTYKWLLGPYATAFLYAAPRWKKGRALEENIFNREALESGRVGASDNDRPYMPGARRFDRGQRDTFSGVPATIEALKLHHGWGRAAVEERIGYLTTRLVARLTEAGVPCPAPSGQAPHVLGLRGFPADTVEQCRARNVFISLRADVVRVAPHVFNTEDDIDRCAQALVDIHRERVGRVGSARAPA